MSDEYRVAFSRANLNRYRQPKQESTVMRQIGFGLIFLGMLIIVLFFWGVGCIPKKNVINAETIKLSPEDVITVRPTVFGIIVPGQTRFVSSTHEHIQLSLESFLRLKIDGEAQVKSDLQDSLTEKVLKMTKEGKERPDLVKIEPELINYSLRINGERVYVQAIKAKGPRQKLAILNNSNNPLILERTRNPFHRANLLAEGDWKQNILGYRITDLMVSGYK